VGVVDYMKRIRVIALLLVLGLVVGACATSEGEAPLVILDVDGAVVVVTPNGEEVERFDPEEGAQYFQPIWASPDTVVRAQIAQDDNRLIASQIDGGDVWSVEFATAPFFYLASPDPAGTTVVSLRNNDRAAGLIAEVVDGSEPVEIVGQEAPFYMSWAPDGATLATHAGGTRLDVRAGTIETIGDPTGRFQAPVWLNDGLVTIRSQGLRTFLAVWDGASFTNVARVRGSARFVGAGRRVAIQTTVDANENGIAAAVHVIPVIRAGPLAVVDLEDGSVTVVTPDASPVFQWDRSGTRLLFLTLVEGPEPLVAWRVWEDGKVSDFEPFQPDLSWLQVFGPFADQYAQSVSLWSRDGSSFAYPAVVDGESRILVQDLIDDSPRDIGEGVWVAWAP
jgi:hypothetical protein